MKRIIGNIALTSIVAAGTAAIVAWQLVPKAQAQPVKPAPLATKRPKALVTLRQTPGGSIVVPLGYGIEVDKGSSLQRTWYVIDDDSAPIKLQTAGVRPAYKSESYGGSYIFNPVGNLEVESAATAFEVRFMLFDVWGRHIQTLSATSVTDFAPKAVIDLKGVGTWNTFENQVSEYLTSVGFLARARLTDGTLWTFDQDAIFDKVKAVTSELTREALTPERRSPGEKK